ncbi:SixA phosphatase family protein [Desulfofustis glycolicus]|uniref:Phosphohistidine phosphatase n=1 Tax=Desulfofustis glycolicus DSM 9705 TaxID=1121409 RepID=A0A1M5W7C6_9BACT|nr:histidine phosphatase family protein [Desulfofustis glycolicus]MCB2217307.1 histidine phosphatase family protein [Desulfobulbaceae bacterium]SHH83489.1 phosphohistidine phosphatase [Desulfofustis glycolicus DSM 9705]
MKQLYLIRHAKSSWSDTSLDDFDRPLSGRGKRDAPLIGGRLARTGMEPQLFLASPAKRARKTAAAIAAEIGYPKQEIVLVDALYTFQVDGLLAVLRSIDEAVASLALVGHNEAISEAARWLTGEDISSVPTCGVVSLAVSSARWRDLAAGCGRVVFFDYPKRAGAGDSSA